MSWMLSRILKNTCMSWTEEEEESALILYPREQDNTIDIASARTSDDLLR